MQDLIDSFISETVLNSASVPVVMTDSTRTAVVHFQRVDSRQQWPTPAEVLPADMASANDRLRWTSRAKAASTSISPIPLY